MKIVTNFYEELDKIKRALKETCDIEISESYDGILIKQMKNTNLLNEKKTGDSKSKQTHIALTGEDSFDFFPHINITSFYNDEYINQTMKSFYILQVPFKIYKKNANYADANSVEKMFSDESLIAKGSVKIGHHNSEKSQIELGHPSQSDDIFKYFRSFFDVDDLMILLKVTGKLEYEGYILKNEDLSKFELKSKVLFNPQQRKPTKIDIFQVNSELIKDEDSYYHTNSNKKIRGINKIYFGAPGTGKSYGIKNFIKENGIEDYNDKIDHPRVFRTSVHPEFTYNDFIGQVMPVIEEGKDRKNIIYDFTPNVFTDALKAAFSNENIDKPIFLIIEEMSRANIAAVFGDLFQLLDRDIHGESEYRINNSLIANYIFKDAHKKIYLPSNLFIIGTVNTSDQNVYVMDTAFKRRFEFEYISPNDMKKNLKDEYLNNWSFTLKNEEKEIVFNWIRLIKALNKFIVSSEEIGGLSLSEDKQIGQFFVKFVIDEKDDKSLSDVYNYNQIKGKLLQYLWDDVQKVSYSQTKLFIDSVNSFGELNDLADKKLIFFSDNFLNIYNSFIEE